MSRSVLVPLVFAAACAPDDIDIASRAAALTAAYPETIASLPGGCPSDVAVTGGGEVAWITYGDPDFGNGGEVAIAAPDGSPRHLVDVHQGGSLFARGDTLYWTSETKIGRVNRDGTGKKIVAQDLTARAQAVAADASFVYWVSGAGVFRVSRDGGTITQLAPVASSPLDLALDDTHVYWVELGDPADDAPPSDGRVMRVAKAGGTPQTVLAGVWHPAALALDDSNVYIESTGRYAGGLTGDVDGAILRVAKTGGTPATLVSGVRGASGIDVDATHVYYAENVGNLKRVRKDGASGSPTYVISNEASPAALDASSGHVVWVNGCGGQLDSVRRLIKSQVGPNQCRAGEAEPITGGDIFSLAQTGTWIYFAEETGNALERVWRNGGRREIVAGDRPARPERIFADRDGVVWVENGGDVVVKQNSERRPRVVAHALDPDVAADFKWVYFTDAAGRIRRVLREGVAFPLDVTTTVGKPMRLTHRGDTLYFSEQRGGVVALLRVADTGGTAVPIVDTSGRDGARIAGEVSTDASRVRMIVSVEEGGSELWTVDGVTGLSVIATDLELVDIDFARVTAAGEDGAVLAVGGGTATPLPGSESELMGELDVDGSCVTWAVPGTGILKLSGNP